MSGNREKEGVTVSDELDPQEQELRQVIVEVLEGDVALTELMNALEIDDPGAFHQLCRDLSVPDDLLVSKIQRDRAALK